MRFELTRAEPNRLPTGTVVRLAGDRLNHSAILSVDIHCGAACAHYLHERFVTLIRIVLLRRSLLRRANTGTAFLGALLFCNGLFGKHCD